MSLRGRDSQKVTRSISVQDTYHAQTDGQRAAVVIEDDPDIRDLIITVFQQAGFTVHSAAGGTEGVEAVRRFDPTVVTLDLGLPDIDGFEVARRIRTFCDCYIIMVSARTEEAETLMGLAVGADDFITKPFRPRELRARVAAMLRRPRASAAATEPAPSTPAGASSSTLPAPMDDPGPTEAAAGEQQEGAESGVFEYHGLRLDPATRAVSVQQRCVELTRTEFDLLHTLMRSGRRVRTKTDLVRHLRADHFASQAYVSEADERAVEVHIGNLRRKIGQTAKGPAWVETVRGVGYRMTEKPPPGT